METYLCCFASEKPKTWATYLAWAELSYNSAFHSALKMTPFRALYGRDPPTWIKFENGSTTNGELEGQLKDRDGVLKLLRENLHRAQQIMKDKVDKHRREMTFEVGEWVHVKLRPYRQKTLARRLNEKLYARFYGPFEIEAKIGKVAYKVKLPEEAKIHPRFHVSQLKKTVGETSDSLPLPPQLNSEGELIVVPEGVVASRVHEVLIRRRY